MILPSSLTEIGSFVKTHGIDGELSATFSIDDIDATLAELRCIMVDIEGLFVPFFISRVRSRGPESRLIKLDDVDSEISAAHFVGKTIFAPKDIVGSEVDSPSDDGFYAADLIGFNALDDDGTPLGTITDIDDRTDNVLFILTSPSGVEFCIPVVEEYITDISPESLTISFSLPEGLLDL